MADFDSRDQTGTSARLAGSGPSLHDARGATGATSEGPTGSPPQFSAPQAGTEVPSRSAIVVDVTDDSGAPSQVRLHLEIDGGPTCELIFTDDDDGAVNEEGFAPKYARSTRTAIQDGYRYTIRRGEDWPRYFRVLASATDSEGL